MKSDKYYITDYVKQSISAGVHNTSPPVAPESLKYKHWMLRYTQLSMHLAAESSIRHPSVLFT